MATFDTTATAQEDTWLAQGEPNTDHNSVSNLYVRTASGNNDRTILNFVLPQKPTGADTFDRLTMVLTYEQALGAATAIARSYKVNELQQNWTEGSATWNNYAGNGTPWTTAGGDVGNVLTVLNNVTGSYGSSFVFDISKIGITWGERGSVLVSDAVE